ncbi:MAG: sensor histidine kinase [Butyrivibrio sp.]|nr:sensor histidine kinase [Butyrivibrio sp.]
MLSDLTKCTNVQEALEAENEAFEKYIRNDIDTNKIGYENACLHTRACINRLPYTYSRIGAERYARTWRVMNAYDYYETQREEILSGILHGHSVQKLYDLYEMQNNLNVYIRDLMQITVSEGSIVYQKRVSFIEMLPFIVALVSIFAIILALVFGSVLATTLTRPLKTLAKGVKDISDKNFDSKDIAVANEDEIGELVDTFNDMKHVMAEHINTINENQLLTERVHRDELERVEMEKQLNLAQLDLLQSQINPHFLFNTLNVISGMAELEEAATTKKLINSLSHLFRYNLRTNAQYVSLSQEISILDDYMYLQKMRFGSRLSYDKDIEEGLDTNSISVPVFMLQPLAENSIIHGLAGKEEGGSVSLKVYTENESIYVEIIDTGIGINEDKLKEINSGKRIKTEEHTGIGFTNITRRLKSLYEESSVRVESSTDKGTKVIICIKS